MSRGVRRSGRRRTFSLVHPGRFHNLCFLSNVVTVYHPVLLLLPSDVVLEVFVEALEVFMEVFFAAVVEVIESFQGTRWIRWTSSPRMSFQKPLHGQQTSSLSRLHGQHGQQTSPLVLSSLSRHAAASWPWQPCFGGKRRRRITLRLLVALGLLQIGRGATTWGAKLSAKLNQRAATGQFHRQG